MDAKTIARLLEYFDFKQFFEQNPPLRLLVILLVMCLFALTVRFVCSILQKKLEKISVAKYHFHTGSGVKSVMDTMDFELFEKFVQNIKNLLYLGVCYWGSTQLNLGPIYVEICKIIFTALGILVGIKFFSSFIPFNIDLSLRRRGATLKTSQTQSLMPIVKGVIWAIGLTFLLDNLGLHVSTIIAGLGIVGVAVGLAGQAILADFFSYIVILLDKPFRIGDFIEISDGRSGAVEYMGPKTVHLRSLEDDLIVCANSELTKGVLINQGSIHERVVIEEIGVAYDTPPEQLKRLSDLLRDIVNSFPQCSFDRACLLSFGSSNLIYQLIYLVGEQRGGLRDFMNTRSQMNIAIIERFAEEGITMAYPTETVIMKGQGRSGENALTTASTGPEQTPGSTKKIKMPQKS